MHGRHEETHSAYGPSRSRGRAPVLRTSGAAGWVHTELRAFVCIGAGLAPGRHIRVCNETGAQSRRICTETGALPRQQLASSRTPPTDPHRDRERAHPCDRWSGTAHRPAACAQHPDRDRGSPPPHLRRGHWVRPRLICNATSAPGLTGADLPHHFVSLIWQGTVQWA